MIQICSCSKKYNDTVETGNALPENDHSFYGENSGLWYHSSEYWTLMGLLILYSINPIKTASHLYFMKKLSSRFVKSEIERWLAKSHVNHEMKIMIRQILCLRVSYPIVIAVSIHPRWLIEEYVKICWIDVWLYPPIVILLYNIQKKS